MQVPPEALQCVFSWANGPALTGSLSQHQRYMLEALFQNPCFFLRGLDTPFFSRCGTRPGDSIADALFTVVFADCLASMRERMSEVGLLHSPHGSSVVQPTWADDLAVPVIGAAAEIEHKSRMMCQIVHEVLGSRALEVNYKAGKTELLTSWAGLGARNAKRALLALRDSLDFEAFGVRRQVRLTLAYTHLGTKLCQLCDSLSCCRLQVQSRQGLGQFSSVGQARASLPGFGFGPPKAFCLFARILCAVLSYNAAVLHGLTISDKRSWAQAVDFLARLLLPDDRLSDSPKHPTVYEVCGAVGLPEPQAFLSQLRIFHAIWAACCDCEVLWDLLLAEADCGGAPWLMELRSDFEWLAYWVPSPFLQQLPVLPFDELVVALSTRSRFIQRSVRNAVAAQVDTLRQWDDFQWRQRQDGVFSGVQWVHALPAGKHCLS